MKNILLTAVMVLTTTVPVFADESEHILQIFEDLKNIIISVSESIKPSVVHVDVVQKINNQKFETLGSGLIIDSLGYILTNEHVVENAQSVTVTLDSKIEYPAEIIITDKQTDLALIKIDTREELKVATLGDSDSCKVGEWVIAVGNPYGFDRTVSFGIISGKGRVLRLPIETPLINDFLQTDAVIDPGSSGGPLVNLRGEVIGINSIGYGRGQGFTIPINIAREIADKRAPSDKIERGWIGIVTQPISREFAAYFNDKQLQGILVSEVLQGSPADRAGLRPMDIIVALNGKDVRAEKEDDLNMFSQMISSTAVGEKVELEIVRNNRRKKMDIEVGLQPKVKADEYEDEELGLTVKEITETMYRQYVLETKEGVFVQYAEIGGVAGEAKLETGDLIIAVEDDPVSSLDEFKSTLQKYKDRKMLLFRIIRGKNRLFALLDRRDNNGRKM
jgi:Do/DeqQ family serine protease